MTHANEHPRKPPTAQQVRELRARAGLTQAEAARLVHTNERRWREWEAGQHRMAPATYELALIKVGQIGGAHG